jgi:hypothetical protein
VNHAIKRSMIARGGYAKARESCETTRCGPASARLKAG